jgi:hypothetical protein
LHTLENVIEWAIRLASQSNQSNRRGRSSRRNTSVSQRSGSLTRAPNGSILPPSLPTRSASATPDLRPNILRINQAAPTEPTYPSINRFYRQPERPLPPTPQEPVEIRGQVTSAYRASPQEEVHQITPPHQELYCYYPEEIYLSSVLPTRTPRELRHFQEHCFRIYQHQEGLDIVYEHGINRIRQITTSPLNFQGLLWKSKTTLSIGGITEYYCWIRRHTRANNVARVNLEPPYQVDYDWTESLWTVGRLARHPST